MVSSDELIELSAMSARIGADSALVQGPGGNTSIKSARELWVKASGLWLSEALAKSIFVPIDLTRLRGLPTGADLAADAVLADRNPDGLRPSIETALHALMPHRVVIHAHAVNCMAAAVRADGAAFAGTRLGHLRWRWVPYHRPGAPLARAVATALNATPCDILLLQNHGIVVGADTVPAAEALLRDVDRLLATPARRAAPAVLPSPPASQSDGRLVPDRAAGAIAMDADAVRVLADQALIPDQIVFLGGAVPTCAGGVADAEALLDRHAARTGVVPALVLLPGTGALALRDMSDAARTVIDALLAVAVRIPPGAPVTGLSPVDIDALRHWDAEAHRKALDAQRRGI